MPRNPSPTRPAPDSRPSSSLPPKTIRFVIALVALAVFVLIARAEWAHRPLLAQDETATPTVTPTASETPTATITPTFDPFATATPTVTPTFDPFATATWTPTWTPTFAFVPQSPLGTPTPTPRPARIVTEIVSPRSGDAAAGFAPIFGTALRQAFRKYDLHIAPAGSEAWSWLVTSQDVVHDDQLYLLDTTALPDGLYDLRVRAIGDDGNYTEAFLRGLEIRNANPPTPTPNFNELGTLIPPPPESPLEPTPTPRPRILQNFPNGPGIFAPEVGQTVSGYVEIVGTANGGRENPFERYEIAISAAGQGAWNWLDSSEEQMWQGVLHTLDTTRFPDGYYDLRLRIVYRDANYDDFILRYVQIANAGRPAPSALHPNGIVRPKSDGQAGGIVNFIGTAMDPDFLRWELAWAPAGSGQWAHLTTGDKPVIEGALARLDLSKLAGATLDFRLRVVRQDLNYDEYFLRNLFVTAP